LQPSRSIPQKLPASKKGFCHIGDGAELSIRPAALFVEPVGVRNLADRLYRGLSRQLEAILHFRVGEPLESMFAEHSRLPRYLRNVIGGKIGALQRLAQRLSLLMCRKELHGNGEFLYGKSIGDYGRIPISNSKRPDSSSPLKREDSSGFFVEAPCGKDVALRTAWHQVLACDGRRDDQGYVQDQVGKSERTEPDQVPALR
jgi:hypothetical protein